MSHLSHFYDIFLVLSCCFWSLTVPGHLYYMEKLDSLEKCLFLQNNIMVLLAHFITTFKIKCPVINTKNYISVFPDVPPTQNPTLNLINNDYKCKHDKKKRICCRNHSILACFYKNLSSLIKCCESYFTRLVPEHQC